MDLKQQLLSFKSSQSSFVLINCMNEAELKGTSLDTYSWQPDS